MKAQVCRFKRNASAPGAEPYPGPWEDGIMIGTEDDETHLIVDLAGKPITQTDEVFDFRLTPEEGCFETFAHPPSPKAEVPQPDMQVIKTSRLKFYLLKLLEGQVPIPAGKEFDIVDADIRLDRKEITFRWATTDMDDEIDDLFDRSGWPPRRT